jgi:hypothetical protein
MNMDVITHTIVAVGSLACAYYGGRWLLIREARKMFPAQTPREFVRHIRLMDAIIERMVAEDEAEIDHRAERDPLQLELFPCED